MEILVKGLEQLENSSIEHRDAAGKILVEAHLNVALGHTLTEAGWGQEYVDDRR